MGVGVSGLGLTALTFGLIEGPGRGWASPAVLGTIVGGLATLVVFLLWERRVTRAGVHEPVLDLALWSIPEFRWGAVGAAVANLVMFAVMFVVPLHFQGVMGADALGTGLRLLPLIGGLLVGFPLGIVLSSTPGPRPATVIGFLVTAGGSWWALGTSVTSGYGGIALWLTVVGLGFGIALIACQNLACRRTWRNAPPAPARSAPSALISWAVSWGSASWSRSSTPSIATTW